MRTLILTFCFTIAACSSSDPTGGSTSSSSSSSSSSSGSSATSSGALSSGGTSSGGGGAGEGACEGWHQTSTCKGNGPAEPQNDKDCSTTIVSGASGYCSCAGGDVPTDCGHSAATCTVVCAAGSWEATSSTSSSSGSTSGGWADEATCVKGAENFYECCGLGGGSCTTPEQNAACCENRNCASGKLLACMANYTPSSVDACNAALTACQ